MSQSTHSRHHAPGPAGTGRRAQGEVGACAGVAAPTMMFTVHRASTGADWHQATALLYDYVEWVRGWTDFDPLAEQPQLHAELASLADHYASEAAALYLVDWQAIAVGVVAIRAQPDGSAELKRMYVRPIARGARIADRLIDAAVAGATERQCHTALARDAPWCHGPGDRGLSAQRLRRVIHAAAHAGHGRRHRHGAHPQRGEPMRVSTTADSCELAVLDHRRVALDA